MTSRSDDWCTLMTFQGQESWIQTTRMAKTKHARCAHGDFVHRVVCLACIHTHGLGMSVNCHYHMKASSLL